MKKQITTMAAMVIASNVAMAGMSQQSTKLSNESINSIIQASDVLSQGTVQLVKGSAKVGSNASAVSFKKLLELAADTSASTSRVAGRAYDETIDSAKSASGKASGVSVKVADATVASAKSASQGISNAAEFTVEKTEILASGSTAVVSATLKSVNGHVMMGLKFTYNVSQSFGKGMVEASADVLKLGRKVIVAASNSGVVLVTDSANGIENVLNGDIKGGSSTLIGSFSHASKAFGSKIVD